MAWIESHQSLGRHPKTKAAARALGISRVQLVGHLQYLWWWALDFAEDGNLSDIPADDIAEEAMWEGDAQHFIDALTDAGFMTPDGYLNDWSTYTGRIVAQREANRKRQQRFRDRQRDGEHETPETTVKSVTEPLPNDGVTVTSPLRNGATVPNQTKPNPTGVDIAASPAPAREAEPAPKAPPKRKRATPLPENFQLTDSLRQFARDRDFADVEIDREFEKFRAYWQGEGRTKRDWPATWRSWILNAVERRPRAPARASPNGAPGPRGYTPDQLLAKSRGEM